jgi:hypothetical protein
MTAALLDALKRMQVIREGLVVRNLDGTAKTDTPSGAGDRADLATGWLGRKRIDETMLYAPGKPIGTDASSRCSEPAFDLAVRGNHMASGVDESRRKRFNYN